MFGAIGDATCDRAPLQVGQFESDNPTTRRGPATSTAVLKARPVYDGTERLTAEDWPDAVAEILRAPVAIRSHGPGPESKMARPHAAISR